MKKLAMFAAGVLFGTAGIKLLSSKDAKKAYTHTTAAVLRAKDSVMKTVTTARENVEDIYSDAKAINEQRAEDEAALRAAVEQIREKRRREQEDQDSAKEQSDGEHTGESVETDPGALDDSNRSA